jgi:hypothetical protein
MNLKSALPHQKTQNQKTTNKIQFPLYKKVKVK